MPLYKHLRGSTLSINNQFSRGLFAAYIADTGTGSFVFDISRNSNELNFKGEAKWESTDIGFSIGLNGVNSYLEIPYQNLNLPSKAFTLFLKLKILEGNKNTVIWSAANSNTDVHSLISVGLDNKLKILIATDTQVAQIISDTTIPINEWFTVALSWGTASTYGDGNLRGYLNGKIFSQIIPLLGDLNSDIFTNIRIGSKAYETEDFLKCNFKSALIYDKQMTSCEISELNSDYRGVFEDKYIYEVASIPSFYNNGAIKIESAFHNYAFTSSVTPETFPELVVGVRLEKDTHTLAFLSFSAEVNIDNIKCYFAIHIDENPISNIVIHHFTKSFAKSVIGIALRSEVKLSAGDHIIHAEWYTENGATVSAENLSLIVLPLATIDGEQIPSVYKSILSDSSVSTVLEEIDGINGDLSLINSNYIASFLSGSSLTSEVDTGIKFGLKTGDEVSTVDIYHKQNHIFEDVNIVNRTINEYPKGINNLKGVWSCSNGTIISGSIFLSAFGLEAGPNRAIPSSKISIVAANTNSATMQDIPGVEATINLTEFAHLFVAMSFNARSLSPNKNGYFCVNIDGVDYPSVTETFIESDDNNSIVLYVKTVEKLFQGIHTIKGKWNTEEDNTIYANNINLFVMGTQTVFDTESSSSSGSSSSLSSQSSSLSISSGSSESSSLSFSSESSNSFSISSDSSSISNSSESSSSKSSNSSGSSESSLSSESSKSSLSSLSSFSSSSSKSSNSSGSSKSSLSSESSKSSNSSGSSKSSLSSESSKSSGSSLSSLSSDSSSISNSSESSSSKSSNSSESSKSSLSSESSESSGSSLSSLSSNSSSISKSSESSSSKSSNSSESSESSLSSGSSDSSSFSKSSYSSESSQSSKSSGSSSSSSNSSISMSSDSSESSVSYEYVTADEIRTVRTFIPNYNTDKIVPFEINGSKTKLILNGKSHIMAWLSLSAYTNIPGKRGFFAIQINGVNSREVAHDFKYSFVKDSVGYVCRTVNALPAGEYEIRAIWRTQSGAILSGENITLIAMAMEDSNGNTIPSLFKAVSSDSTANINYEDIDGSSSNITLKQMSNIATFMTSSVYSNLNNKSIPIKLMIDNESVEAIGYFEERLREGVNIVNRTNNEVNAGVHNIKAQWKTNSGNIAITDPIIISGIGLEVSSNYVIPSVKKSITNFTTSAIVFEEIQELQANITLNKVSNIFVALSLSAYSQIANKKAIFSIEINGVTVQTIEKGFNRANDYGNIIIYARTIDRLIPGVYTIKIKWYTENGNTMVAQNAQMLAFATEMTFDTASSYSSSLSSESSTSSESSESSSWSAVSKSSLSSSSSEEYSSSSISSSSSKSLEISRVYMTSIPEAGITLDGVVDAISNSIVILRTVSDAGNILRGQTLQVDGSGKVKTALNGAVPGSMFCGVALSSGIPGMKISILRFGLARMTYNDPTNLSIGAPVKCVNGGYVAYSDDPMLTIGTIQSMSMFVNSLKKGYLDIEINLLGL